jgi:SAM-dependent methyltransferase
MHQAPTIPSRTETEDTFDPAQYWESRLSDRFSLRGVGDIGLPESYNKCLYTVRSRAFRRVAQSLGVKFPQQRVLDVGSGVGFYINEWKRLGVTDLVASDITSVATSQLQRSFPDISAKQMDISSDDLPALDQFNVVSAFDVLFHIVDDSRYARAIQNISAFLKPGGYFLYSDNLMPAAWHTTHQVGRSEDFIVQQLAENDFKVVGRFPMFVLMNDPVRSRNRVLRRLFAQIYRCAARGERWGRFVGIVLLPLELMLLHVVRNGPSTEILICQKK